MTKQYAIEAASTARRRIEAAETHRTPAPGEYRTALEALDHAYQLGATPGEINDAVTRQSRNP